jgi:hypothetical protein
MQLDQANGKALLVDQAVSMNLKDLHRKPTTLRSRGLPISQGFIEGIHAHGKSPR